MPIPNSSAHVAVVTGYVDRDFAVKELYTLGVFLQAHPLWDAQIEQINVTQAKELELVPRVGEHIIFLGKPGNYEEKFEKLKTFYEKGLNQVGWNKYSRISLEFNNQIICTKKRSKIWQQQIYSSNRTGILQDHRYCRKETCGRKHTSAGPRQRKLFGFYP